MSHLPLATILASALVVSTVQGQQPYLPFGGDKKPKLVEFNALNVLPVWVKLGKPKGDFEFTPSRVDSHLKASNPQAWRKAEDNEFELVKVRKAALAEFKKKVEECKTDAVFESEDVYCD